MSLAAAVPSSTTHSAQDGATAAALLSSSGPATASDAALAAASASATAAASAGPSPTSSSSASPAFALARPSTSFPTAWPQELEPGQPASMPSSLSSPLLTSPGRGAAASRHVAATASAAAVGSNRSSSNSNSNSSSNSSSQTQPRPPQLWSTSDEFRWRHPFGRWSMTSLENDDPQQQEPNQQHQQQQQQHHRRPRRLLSLTSWDLDENTPRSKRRRLTAPPSLDSDISPSSSSRGEHDSSSSRRSVATTMAGPSEAATPLLRGRPTPATAQMSPPAHPRSLAGSWSSPRSGGPLDALEEIAPQRPPWPWPTRPPRSPERPARMEVIEALGGDSSLRSMFIRIDTNKPRPHSSPALVVEACLRWKLTLLELETYILPHWNLNCGFPSRDVFFDFVGVRAAASPNEGKSRPSRRSGQGAPNQPNEKDDNGERSANRNAQNSTTSSRNTNNASNDDSSNSNDDEDEDEDDDLPMMLPRGGRFRPRRPPNSRLLGTLMGLEFQVDRSGLLYSSARWVQCLDGTILARLMTDARPTEIGGVDEVWNQEALESLRRTVWRPDLHWLFPRRTQQRLHFLAWVGRTLNLEPWWTQLVLPFLSGEY